MVKSFLNSGRLITLRTAIRSSRLPLNQRASVSTETASAPAAAYVRACAVTSRSAASTPLDGEAFLTSAISRTRRSPPVRASAKSRAGPRPRQAASRAACGRAARRAATSSRLWATISSSTPMAGAGALVVSAQAALPRGADVDPGHLLEDVLANRPGRREIPHEPPARDEGLEQRFGRPAVGPNGRGLVRGQHLILRHARQAPHLLGAGALAALGHRLALDLHDVEGEGEHRRVGDRRAHPVAVHQGVELEDLVRSEERRVGKEWTSL